MKNILIVEDEERIRKLVVLYLKKEGWGTIEAGTGETGVQQFQAYAVDLVILDIMLPDTDGWTVCRKIKQMNPAIPVVMLTARKTEDDELFGFELGADEYITKPFNPNILVARIKVAFKKTASGVSQILSFPDLTIDPSKHQVIYQQAPIDLSPKEYDLLLYFAQNAESALHRERILDHVWGQDYYVDDRVIDTTVKRLRKKLDGRYIKTIRAFGYKFEAEA